MELKPSIEPVKEMMSIERAIQIARIILSEDPHYNISQEDRKDAYDVLATWHSTFAALQTSSRVLKDR